MHDTPRRPRPRLLPANLLVAGLASAGAVVLVILIFLNGFDNEVAGLFRVRVLYVDTWSEWCEHLEGYDLEQKHGARDVIFVGDRIRQDFLHHYRPVFIETCKRFEADQIVAGAADVWIEGTAIHLSNDAALSGRWLDSIRHKISSSWMLLERDEFLIYGTMATVFEEAVFHQSGDRISRIVLPYLLDD
jgi:hypothetical protein